MEAALLVLDQVVQSLAVQRRGLIRRVRFQPCALFSELEVRVERSKRRVVLILNGVDGPLRWRDLQASKTLFPGGARPDDPVEFIIQMDGQ